MPRDALRTLFHPFETGVFDGLRQDGRSLFLGAEPGFLWPEGVGPASLVQGFRPYVLELQTAGHAVTPRADDSDYALVLVLAGRHRGRNELQIAEAIERSTPGALIVVAGGKDDGIASLRKRVGAMLPLEDSLSKHHGVAFWFRRNAEATAAAALLRADNPQALVEGRFHTAPGMFSFDRVDPGSRLLADNLPTDMKGAVADFCAGWGYLSSVVVEKARSLSALDLYEADFESIEMAKQNVGDVGIQPRFFWRDLLKEPTERRYDVIVMNPPFHQDRSADPDIGRGMIKKAAAALKSGGRLFMVANKRLPYEAALDASFSHGSELARDDAFKVFVAYR